MKKFYIDPASGKTFKTREEVTSSFKKDIPFEMFPAYILDDENGVVTECTVDPSMKSIFINTQIPVSKEKSFISNVNLLMDSLPKQLDYTSSSQHILLDRKPFLFLCMEVRYSRVPLLDGDSLADKIFALGVK